jgi:ketosteroid isomerase-like protein
MLEFMTTMEVGNRLVELVRAGQEPTVWEELYHPEIVSIEAAGPERESKGLNAIRGKAEWFNSMFENHGVEVLGPYANEDKFAVHYCYDLTTKEGGHRIKMNEIALYQVKDDRIIWEKFYYDPAAMGG